MKLNEIQKNILLFLYKHYPDFVSSENIITELKINSEDLRKESSFLEEEYLIEMKKFLGGNFLAKLTSHGKTTMNELSEEPSEKIKPEKKIKKEPKDIEKIRNLQDTILKTRDDVANIEKDFQEKIREHENKITIFDKKLNEFYVRLIEIFGIFAAILALVTFTGNAIFNSNFNIYETLSLIVGFGVVLGIFIYVLDKIVIKKNKEEDKDDQTKTMDTGC